MTASTPARDLMPFLPRERMVSRFRPFRLAIFSILLVDRDSCSHAWFVWVGEVWERERGVRGGRGGEEGSEREEGGRETEREGERECERE